MGRDGMWGALQGVRLACTSNNRSAQWLHAHAHAALSHTWMPIAWPIGVPLLKRC